jgi:hypothetical protein
MKTSSNLLFNASFVLVLALIAAQGALMCFWPKRWKSLQSRFPRGYHPDSLGGRMLERYRARDATLGDRFGGAALLAMAIGGLFWFVHYLLGGGF